MTTSAPNEPTEGPGGMRVLDSEGVFVGTVLPPEELDPPSEDVARIGLRLSPEVVERYALQGNRADLEATWLHAPDAGDHMILDRPIGLALREQGFDID